MLTIGSLFSGVGGLELGLEWAGLGPTIWQVEREPFCRAVLAKHWPEAARFDDVRTVGANELVRPALICGGFPCQDVSGAGKGAGLAGERSGLWREFARIASELLPEWIVVENVKSGAKKWLDPVVRDLEQLGYECLPVPLSASDVGAWHERARVFVVAHLDGERELQSGRLVGVERGRLGDGAGEVVADVDGQRGGARTGDPRGERSGRAEPGGGVDGGGVAADPHGQLIRIEPGGGSGTSGPRASEPGDDGATRDVADALRPRREGPGPGAHESRRGPPAGARWAPVPDLVPVVHGVSTRLAGRGRRARIRALGNTVVPQDAEVIGWIIRELIAGNLTPTPTET